MRQEEIDWRIYHIIADECNVSAETISSKTDFDEDMVKESLKRLESGNLIGYDGEIATLLTPQEMILKCRIKNAVSNTDSPVIIENGVIKENPYYRGQERI